MPQLQHPIFTSGRRHSQIRQGARPQTCVGCLQSTESPVPVSTFSTNTPPPHTHTHARTHTHTLSLSSFPFILSFDRAAAGLIVTKEIASPYYLGLKEGDHVDILDILPDNTSVIVRLVHCFLASSNPASHSSARAPYVQTHLPLPFLSLS